MAPVARRLGNGKLLIQWSGGHYSHAQCFWSLVAPHTGTTLAEGQGTDAQEASAASHAKVMAERKTLFLGFADGAPNIVVVDDPAPQAPASQLRFVLVDTKSNESTAVFGCQPCGTGRQARLAAL